MLKKLIILSVALLLLIGTGAMIAIAPYHIYTLTLTEGVSTRFLVMKPSAPAFYDGQDFSYEKTESENEDKLLYETFHFSNFLVPMPFNHPIFSMIPTIKIENSSPRLGASFLDGKNSLLLSFMVEKSLKLETVSGEQKLFILPVFKNHIARKSEAEVWRDLFSKKLSLPSNEGKGFFDSLFVLRKVTYSDLVYNLYILYNRAQLLPLNAKRISFDPQTAHGLIELPSDDPLFKVERLYLLEKGLVYSLTLKTRMDIEAAVNFRNKILRETVFKNSTSDSAIPVYAHYKTIAYAHRVDQQGMAYLYSAWSHDLANKEYIRVIILFLERGKSNLKFLKPFYEYAYKRFGSNLSTENEFLLESADEKLKRKMKEELEVEVKKEAQTSGPKFEGNFSNPDEKINFYLKKAKDNKMNSDDDAKTLLQE